jgi:hypothetical protein
VVAALEAAVSAELDSAVEGTGAGVRGSDAAASCCAGCCCGMTGDDCARHAAYRDRRLPRARDAEVAYPADLRYCSTAQVAGQNFQAFASCLVVD